MGNQDAVEAEIIDIIQKKIGKPDLTISRSSNLTDLGLESLDIVEIVFEIEERWNVELPFSANSAGAFEMDTVGEVVDAVRKLLPDA